MALCLSLPDTLPRTLALQVELRTAARRQLFHRRTILFLGALGLGWTWVGVGFDDVLQVRIGLLLLALGTTAVAWEQAVATGGDALVRSRLDRLAGLIGAWAASAAEVSPFQSGAVAGTGRSVADAVRGHLVGQFGDLDVALSEEIGSTNDTARGRAESYEHLTRALVALHDLQEEAEQRYQAQQIQRDRVHLIFVLLLIVVAAVSWLAWTRPLAVVATTLAFGLTSLRFDAGHVVTAGSPGHRLDVGFFRSPGPDTPASRRRVVDNLRTWVLLSPCDLRALLRGPPHPLPRAPHHPRDLPRTHPTTP